MNDEEMTLYYYDEVSASQRRQVESALSTDKDLLERYEIMRERLDALRDIDAPLASAQMVQRWQNVIDRAADLEIAKTRGTSSLFRVSPFFWGVAASASLALAVAIGLYVTNHPEGSAVPAESRAGIQVATTSTAPTAFSRGLLVHFQKSRDQLDQLSHEANGKRGQLIAYIVQQNRLYVGMAKRDGSQDIARVLRAFEPVLLRLAADDISAYDAAVLQSQLAFELNIVLTKLARRVSDETDSVDI